MTSYTDHCYSDLMSGGARKEKKKLVKEDGKWALFSGGQSRRRNGPTLKEDF